MTVVIIPWSLLLSNRKYLTDFRSRLVRRQFGGPQLNKSKIGFNGVNAFG